MKKKRSSKLSLHRETLRKLDRSDLRTVAGASGQLGCPNTLNTCKTCFPSPTLITCTGPSCFGSCPNCPTGEEC